MKKVIKKIGLVSGSAVILISLSACSQLSQKLDVVGKESITSFSAVLDSVSDKVQPDEVNVGWSLSSPDGTVRYIWSKDYSASPLHDVMLELDAQPFLDAGLETSKLPETIGFYENKLMVGTKLGENELNDKGEATPLASYKQIVNLYRDTIGYHAALDHYGVKLGDGNMFEWAKDMGTNDKDIVFVLNPEPFIAAGVDPNAVAGWAFAKVPVDVDGKPTEVDKFLKPFNLK
ncbi:MAG: hypothetical protein K6T85_10405 [Gorillibacterium sp.]|nr:hypothetical protein [Gorillibacterium sp.]